MKEANIIVRVVCPSIEDFSQKYPQYASYAKKAGKELFSFLTTPAMILKAMTASSLGATATSGVAREILGKWSDFGTKKISNYDKQFIGAVICTVMLSNGYEQTGRKKAVGLSGFTKGEVYRKVSND